MSVTGQICSGKSTWCRWFLKRNPKWGYISIDTARKYNLDLHSGGNKYPLEIEITAWNSLRVFADYQIENNLNCLIETTGISWQIDNIWELLQGEDFYTIKLHASHKICKDRVLTRKKDWNHKDLPFPYNGDELIAIDLTQKLIDKVPYDYEISGWTDYRLAEEEILNRG